MTEPYKFLRKLIELPGLSGHESTIREAIAETWRPLVSELSISRIGSLHGKKTGSGEEIRPSILIATHMDAIGLMVNRVVDGFLYTSKIGGIDTRVLPGQPVMIHGRENIPGIIAQPHDSLLPETATSKPVELEYLVVDTGLPAKRIDQLVRVGDLVSFAHPPLDLGQEILAGHSLDNRASVAALTICLEELQTRTHSWDVWAVATVQEEVTLAGAATSAFAINPQIAIAVDVTFASSPGDNSHKTFGLGKGPVLGFGPNIHAGMHKAVKETASRIEMETQLEVMPAHSGTDAILMQVTSAGIPTMVISIPLRYMHTPVEMVSFKDVQRVGRLLAEFIAGLTPNFMDTLSLDE